MQWHYHPIEYSVLQDCNNRCGGVSLEDEVGYLGTLVACMSCSLCRSAKSFGIWTVRRSQEACKNVSFGVSGNALFGQVMGLLNH